MALRFNFLICLFLLISLACVARADIASACGKDTKKITKLSMDCGKAFAKNPKKCPSACKQAVAIFMKNPACAQAIADEASSQGTNTSAGSSNVDTSKIAQVCCFILK